MPRCSRPICATSRLSTSSSTTTAARTARRTASCAARSGRRLRERNLIVERDVAQLYDPEAGTFLADRFVKGTCPQVQGAGPVRRQLRQVRRDLSRDRLDRSGQHAVGRHARDAVRAAPVRRARQAARVPGRVDAVGRASPGGSGQLPAGPFPRRAAARTGTFRGRPRTSASRFPTVRAITGTSGSTRRSATWPPPGSGATGTARSSTTGGAATTRDPPLHRQGHHVLPHAVLARHAQVGRLPLADEGAHPRLPDRRRREDVEVQGHVRHGRDVSATSRSVLPAVLLRLEARPATGRHRPEPGRVRGQGQRRPGRQGGEPGQPYGEVRAGDGPVGHLSRTTADCFSRPRRPATRSPPPTKKAITAGPCG